MTNHKLLNWVFAGQLVLFGLIVTGVLPRETALYLGAALVLYFLAAPIDDTLVFFIRSIPLFLAMPLTTNFDNFNIWRILVLIIFAKWAWTRIMHYDSGIRNFKKLLAIHYSLFTKLLIVLLLFAIFSIIPAPDKVVAIKRIIFFLNFALFGIVVYHKASDKELAKRLVRNSLIPVIIVVAVGYIQIISTYFIDIYQFMRIWGEGIQCRQFGTEWCNIAVWVGNTWFAYFGEQLSLRVFSLFPDSHSFPQFVLLGIPAVFASVKKRGVRIILISLLFLITILSGTRGIWAASVGVLILASIIIWWTRKINLGQDRRNLFKSITAYLIVFFVAFSVAFPIFSSPQFLIGKSEDFLKNRIRSIIDFGETSNAQRIEIWKKTLSSIKEKPLIGVGIGNYPVVLSQDIRLSKAGSSAHNLYLNVAAEMGIIAALVFLWLLWIIFKQNFRVFEKEKDEFLKTYFAAMILFMPWILIYSLTDVAILDERTLLTTVSVTALILGIKKTD